MCGDRRLRDIPLKPPVCRRAEEGVSVLGGAGSGGNISEGQWSAESGRELLPHTDDVSHHDSSRGSRSQTSGGRVPEVTGGDCSLGRLLF